MKIVAFLLPFSIFLACSQKATIPPNQQEIIQWKTIFSPSLTERVACYRIPALLTAQNGTLLAAIDERVPNCGDLRSNEDINIVLRTSNDHGETWSQTVPLIDYPKGESASDPSMILDQQTAEIFLFFNYMNLNTEKNVYYLKMIKSKDHGQTWSAPIDITEQITPKSWKNDFKFITSGRGIQTKSGYLLHTLVNLQKGLHLFGSKDHGKSWFLIETPIQPGDESKIVELDDGAWMINSRVNKAGVRYVHISQDEGQSWTSKPDSTLVDPACNASILRYPKQNGQSILLFSNANAKNQRSNLTIRASLDDGQTWTKSKTLYEGSSAYSSISILQNGEIGLLFEKDNYSEIAFTRFSLEWFFQ